MPRINSDAGHFLSFLNTNLTNLSRLVEDPRVLAVIFSLLETNYRNNRNCAVIIFIMDKLWTLRTFVS